MTETILGEIYLKCTLSFSSVHVPPTNMEEAGFMTYTAASLQGANEMFWLIVWAAVMPSIYIWMQKKMYKFKSLCLAQTEECTMVVNDSSVILLNHLLRLLLGDLMRWCNLIVSVVNNGSASFNQRSRTTNSIGELFGILCLTKLRA